MTRPAISLYVYYRIAREDADAARQAFERARAELGQPIALMQRPPAADARELTWMEVYPPEAIDGEAAMARALAPWLLGERHVERFETLRACP